MCLPKNPGAIYNVKDDPKKSVLIFLKTNQRCLLNVSTIVNKWQHCINDRFLCIHTKKIIKLNIVQKPLSN